MLLTLLVVSLYARNPSLHELKRELEGAQRELAIAQERVSELNYAIAVKEIARIEDLIKRSKEKTRRKHRLPQPEHLSFLTEQREILNKIINTIPPCADRAQSVNETILAYLTDLSNEFDTDISQKKIVR